MSYGEEREATRKAPQRNAGKYQNHSDPFTRGAYAYLPVGGLEAQQNLSRPLDNTLFFAGEATSVGHIGTVHGAIETGQRAAKEILESL